MVMSCQIYGKEPDSERGNLLQPHSLLFLIRSKCSIYAPTHRQDSIYNSLYYTSCGALDGTRNNLICPPWSIDQTTHRIISICSYQRWNGFRVGCVSSCPNACNKIISVCVASGFLFLLMYLVMIFVSWKNRMPYQETFEQRSYKWVKPVMCDHLVDVHIHPLSWSHQLKRSI